MNEPPSTFTCVDCGGVAHLIGFLPDTDPIEPGTPLAYRCSDCLERFDVVWEEAGEEGQDPGST